MKMLFRPMVLPGNHAIRAGLAALALFYLGTLIDEQIFLLLGTAGTSLAGTLWDLLRAIAWLLAFPLISQTLAHSLRASGRPVSRLWTVPGWLTLGLFALPAAGFLENQSPMLANATASVYPWVPK